MHKLIVNPALNLLEARLSGVFSVADARQYDADLRQLFDSGRLKPGYLMLMDVSEAAIQSRAVIDTFMGNIADLPAARRLCVVASNPVVKLQIARAFEGYRIEVLTERAAAFRRLTRRRHAAREATRAD